jgi:hypothetical protein
MNFVQPGGVAVATVALPGGSYPGTDFASAFFNVNVKSTLITFDHVWRSSESLDQKVTYVPENPVRSSLVSSWRDYTWLWQKPLANPQAPPRLA